MTLTEKIHNIGLKKAILGVLIIDLIVSPGVGVALYLSSVSNSKSDEAQSKAHDAALQARATAEAQYQVCLSGNEYRMNDLALWSKVVALVDGHTAAGKKFDSEVLAAAQAVDTPKVCVPPPQVAP